ncbi:MAG: hypothetical protein CMF72_15215 [Mameliella sp.]|nr:hypothetical protein [Mameliella sp.]|tara:strand:- start:3033 stop:3875 length:843 start_codon:yes stop_codon:yes gene_type:complete
MIEVTMRFPARPGQFTAPMGMVTPQSAPVSFTATGARLNTVCAANVTQHLALGEPEADEVVLRWQFAPGGGPYPQEIFSTLDNRFTRAASGVAGETVEIARSAGGGLAGLQAIVDHVAGIFDYGHPEDRFYDGFDEIPHLCDMTTGSCVDINAYLIAGLRSAGYEAGYIYGLFVPEAKRDWAEDGHCWVVTRHDGIVQCWDIAHHLKMGLRKVTPGLNPRPGVRLAMGHSMGWNVPALGLEAVKLMALPLWITDQGPQVPEGMKISMSGYDELAAVPEPA